MAQGYPLILSVKRGSDSWRSKDLHLESSDEEFKRARGDVLKAGRYTCRFCGFKAEKYQHVHHRDNNHTNNSPSNLLIACAYCHHAHHLGFAGLSGEHILIHFDERDQAWINHLCRIYHVSRLQPQSKWAKRIAGIFNYVVTEGMRNIQSVYGEEMMDSKTEDPSWLANFMMSLDEPTFVDRTSWPNFSSLRLMTVKDNDADRIAYWGTVISQPDEWGLLLGEQDEPEQEEA